MPAEVAPVSVIIPCFRSAATVARAFQSVLDQTLQPAEIFLVDDASGDDTLGVLGQLERTLTPKTTVIRLGRNGGPGIARNAAWEVATQPWLAFLDADDVWHPRKLEVQWAWISKNHEVCLCGHPSALARDPMEVLPHGELSASRITKRQMLISNRLPTRSVILQRDLPLRFRGKDVAEDYLLWLEIIASGYPAYRLEQCLAYSLRPDFSPGGYSGELWKHEKRELRSFAALRKSGRLSLPQSLAASVWSLLKYSRRCWQMGATQ